MNIFIAAFILFGLVGCGGGSSAPSLSDNASGSNNSMTTAASDQMASAACCSANQAPMFNDVPDTVQVNENQTQILTATATDSDEDMLSYSLTGADADLLQISQNGTLTFMDAPDFESQNAYNVNIEVTDGVDTTAHALSINITDVAETVSQAPVELVVIVEAVMSGYSSSNKYSVDGEITPTISLERGKTYRFLQSDASNSNHPVRFSLTSNGTHANGTTMTDGITTIGIPGSTGAYTQIQLPADTNLTTLYYFCSNHSGMGGAISISNGSSSGYYIIPNIY